MDEDAIRKALKDLPIPAVRYFARVGSTNDEALAWGDRGGLDLSLVVADEQTAGRGRLGRKWFTPPGAALAFSLVLRPRPAERASPGLITGLGAVALVDALEGHHLKARIKWPNDVLVGGRKVAGILVETTWAGSEIQNLVIGMGVNILQAAVPSAELLNFPATSVEGASKGEVDRLEFLVGILTSMVRRRPLIGTEEFLRLWESALAYRGENVQVQTGEGEPVNGRISGLETDGSLRLVDGDRTRIVRFGEVHLRPS